MATFESPENVVESGKVDLDRMYARAVKKLRGHAVKPEIFCDLYGAQQVEADLDEVRRLERIFEAQSAADKIPTGKLAKIFEWIMLESIELSNWLGEDVVTIVPSQYDDYINHVDSIAEFRKQKGGAEYLAFGIDVTIGIGVVHQKLLGIKDEIRRGKLTRIKYFLSEFANIRGELSKIPRVLIAISAENAKKLAELWSSAKEKSKLADHPIQFQIIDEILLQLEYFIDYSREVGNSEVEKIYINMRDIILRIKTERLEQDGKQDGGEREEGFRAIESELEKVFSR